MIIKSVYKDYMVHFSNNFDFFWTLAKEDNRFLILDRNIYELYREELEPLLENSGVYIMDAVEDLKNIEQVLKIADEMIKLQSKRNTTLISIGGGIVQDVSGFLASVIYRGIRWLWVPTTLLAQADSCIGSKTSLNYRHYKNLFGTFYPPDEIYVNMQFVKTLTKKDFLSGLGEIFKCAIMDGMDSYRETAAALEDMLNRDYRTLAKETEKALRFKKSVIEKDEFDKDYRNIMNYGHTFGHALEAVTEFAVPHGQAVSMGMLIANEISCERGLMPSGWKAETAASLKRICQEELLSKTPVNETMYLDAMRKDKKFGGNTHTCILMTEDGIRKLNDIRDEEIVRALHKLGFC